MDRRAALWLVLSLALPCCQQASEEGDVKRTPKPPPSREPPIPEDLMISVSVDGTSAAPIDAARLKSKPPDFNDGERRAWDLVALLGDSAGRPGAKLGVSADKGPEVVMQAAPDQDGLVPVLLMSRRGDVIATMVDPKAPFPEFHGRGGRLGRRGDPIPRVEGARHIRLFVEASGAPSAKPP